jgi:hypothetical protein
MGNAGAAGKYQKELLVSTPSIILIAALALIDGRDGMALC